MELQDPANHPGAALFSQRPVTFIKRGVWIGDAPPHSCLILSALMPQCPTNLPALP